MLDKHPITKVGYEKLCKEIEYLVEVERPSIITAVSEARALGDLSENAEYHAAKEKQRIIESKINQLEALQSSCELIDTSAIKDTSHVRFGATVKILNLEDETEKTITIVSEYESMPSENKISIETPICKAIIGKSIGDICQVNIGGKWLEFEILSIEYL